MAAVFWVLFALLAIERLAELPVARRNQDRLVEKGARVVENDGFSGLFVVHVVWFVGMGAEFLWAPWAGSWVGTWPLLAGFVGAELLRLWALLTLGERWTTRVVVLDEAPLVDQGPYRFLDHPNYVAVALVLFLVPVAFSLWATAIAASLANLAALRYRIRIEEEALKSAEAGA